MSASSALRAPMRTLLPSAKVTLATGVQLDLSADDIIAFSVQEGADSALMPGNVISAAYVLELNNQRGQWLPGGTALGNQSLESATIELVLSVKVQDQWLSVPTGTFVVSKISAPEQKNRLQLAGSDSIATELAGLFEDVKSYPCTLNALWQNAVGQTRYIWQGDIPNGSAVIDARPAWGEISVRQGMGYIAAAAGSFVRVDRQGALEMVKCHNSEQVALSADEYMEWTREFDEYGPIDALRVTPMPNKAGAQSDLNLYASGSGISTGAMLQVENNPLFMQGAVHLRTLAQGMLDQLSGLTLARAEFRWRGDPSIGVGTRVCLTDTQNRQHLVTVTRQTMAFENGFSATCACETPDDSDAGVLRAITPEGGVNANALVGTIDGGLLAVGSVTANSIYAGAITTDKLAANAVTADKIAVNAITADKLVAGVVDAEAVKAITAAINAITAGDVSTNTLYAAFAHVVSLAADGIQAGNIETDQLAAQLAKVVSLTAATANFDLATIQNLLANALILQEGVADSMMISNLAVTSANLLSATLGELILKGSDGKYYAVVVGADGTIGTEEVTLSADEITSGATSSGKQIVETTANIESLNAQNIKAASAVIGSIFTDALTAGKITAGQALISSATIPELYVTAIKALGNTIDISANKSIDLQLGAARDVQRWFKFSNDQGLIIQKPAYTDSEGVAHAASIWSTVTDETGYHIKRSDLPGYVGSFARDRLIVDGIQIGDIVAQKTSTGGWAFAEY